MKRSEDPLGSSQSVGSFMDLFKIEEDGSLSSNHETIVIHIISYLGYFHVQRLTCTSQTLANILSRKKTSNNNNNNHKKKKKKKLQSAILWLRDLEVLRSLYCPKRLLNKLSHAIRYHPYRIMSFEQGADDYPQTLEDDEKTTLYDVFEQEFPYRFFGGDSPNFQFATVHVLDLEERELEPGEMFDDMEYNYNNNSESGSSSTHHHKPRENYVCEFEHCKEKEGSIQRVFYVDGTSICAKCIDQVCFLKLRFCARFYKAQNSRFEVRELEYDGDKTPSMGWGFTDDSQHSPESWNLTEDEFWVQFWYTAPYNYGELRLIGVGPRHVKKVKQTEKEQENTESKAQNRKIALQSIRKRRKLQKQEEDKDEI